MVFICLEYYSSTQAKTERRRGEVGVEKSGMEGGTSCSPPRSPTSHNPPYLPKPQIHCPSTVIEYCYTAVVTIDIPNSGVRCTPSSYSSAPVRQLCHPQREAASISAGVSFAGHTADCYELRVSGVPCMFSSFKKRHVPTYLSYCLLFVVLRNMTEMIHFILGSSIYR